MSDRETETLAAIIADHCDGGAMAAADAILAAGWAPREQGFREGIEAAANLAYRLRLEGENAMEMKAAIRALAPAQPKEYRETDTLDAAVEVGHRPLMFALDFKEYGRWEPDPENPEGRMYVCTGKQIDEFAADTKAGLRASLQALIAAGYEITPPPCGQGGKHEAE